MPVEPDEAQAGVADVDLEEVGEKVGFALEGDEGFRHEGGGAVHQEHGAGHEVREAAQCGCGRARIGRDLRRGGRGPVRGPDGSRGRGLRR